MLWSGLCPSQKHPGVQRVKEGQNSVTDAFNRCEVTSPFTFLVPFLFFPHSSKGYVGELSINIYLVYSSLEAICDVD